jgi:hypothetical protein
MQDTAESRRSFVLISVQVRRATYQFCGQTVNVSWKNTDNLSGKYWFSNFMQRNSLLSLRTREGQHRTQVVDDLYKACSELVSQFGFTPTKMHSL